MATSRTGKKRLHKRVFKRIDIRKILAAVAIGFTENVILDQIENHVAKVTAGLDAPGVHDGFGHGPKLLQRVIAQPHQEFGTGHVERFPHPARILFLDILHRIIEPRANKCVGPFVETRIFLMDEGDDFGELEVLHVGKGKLVAQAIVTRNPHKKQNLTTFIRPQLGNSSHFLLYDYLQVTYSLIFIILIQLSQKMLATNQVDPSYASGKAASKMQTPLNLAFARLKSAGLRITQPRIAILETLIKRNQPISIEQIHAEVASGACDLVTVYRSLAAFEEIGLVRRSFFHNGTSLYEINLGESSRYHIVCKQTNKVEAIDPEIVSELRKALQQIEDKLRAKGYQDVTHLVEFFGVAPASK